MGLSEEEECSLSLDLKLLRFMDQLELLEEKRAALNSLIEQGWFSMSKARYSMGIKHVSALQYASEMEPLVRLRTRTLENGEVELRTERVAQSKEAGEDGMPVENIGPQGEGVRRRNKPKKEVAEKVSNDEASDGKESDVTPKKKSETNPQQDPLKWFGILVPQSLKQAQSSFKQVIELSAEIATLHAAVLNIKQTQKMAAKDELIVQEETSAAQVENNVD